MREKNRPRKGKSAKKSQKLFIAGSRARRPEAEPGARDDETRMRKKHSKNEDFQDPYMWLKLCKYNNKNGDFQGSVLASKMVPKWNQNGAQIDENGTQKPSQKNNNEK